MSNQPEVIYANLSADNEPYNIESLCTECQQSGKTTLLLSKIPFFQEIIIMSFYCEHCGNRNSEVQFGGKIKEQAVVCTLTLNEAKIWSGFKQRNHQVGARGDLHPGIGIRNPFQQEGVCEHDRRTAPELVMGLFCIFQHRRSVPTATPQKNPNSGSGQQDRRVLEQVREAEVGRRVPFQDGGGRSFWKQLHPELPGSVERPLAGGEAHEQKRCAAGGDGVQRGEREARGAAEQGNEGGGEEGGGEEGAACVDDLCEQPEPGGAVQGEFGGGSVLHRDRMLQLRDEGGEQGLPPDDPVLQGHAADRVHVPPLRREDERDQVGRRDHGARRRHRAESGRSQRHQEGCLQVRNRLPEDPGAGPRTRGRHPRRQVHLRGRHPREDPREPQRQRNPPLSLSLQNPFTGDSVDPNFKVRMNELFGKIEKLMTGEVPFTLIIKDPVENSFIQNLYHPDPDPRLTVTKFKRTAKDDEYLGIDQMKTENYQ